jgi:hypothetical protein
MPLGQWYPTFLLGLDANIHMWGKLMPKRGQFNFPITPVGKEVSNLLSRKDDHVLDTVEHSYAGIDWRGCPNI